MDLSWPGMTLGVSAAFLRRFMAANNVSCAGKTTAQVTGAVKAGQIDWADPGMIVKETQQSQLSYVDAFLLRTADVGIATCLVSHPWAGEQ